MAFINANKQVLKQDTFQHKKERSKKKVIRRGLFIPLLMNQGLLTSQAFLVSIHCNDGK